MISRLRYAPAAKRFLRSLRKPEARGLSQAIESLLDDPYQEDNAIRGSRSIHRLKLPPFRVFYKVTSTTVLVLRIEERSPHTYQRSNRWQKSTDIIR